MSRISPPIEGRFQFTDHACRHCLGRVLERNGLYVCSVCEATCSLKPNGICGCGMKSGNGRALLGREKHFHCGINPNRGPNEPARIVVFCGDTVADPLDVRGA
jgi:hypothetical protein